LDTLQAAILLEKLAIFPEEIIKRNEAAEYYTSNLSNHYETPDIPDGYISAWAQYSILAGSSADRDSAIECLKSHDIPAMIYYKISLHLQKVFSALGYTQGDFPVSEESSGKIFSIPMHPYLDRNQQDAIIEVLNSCE
jgi:dTDP-4-amino-4,6-dideoxygalactose transaminase